MTPPPTDPEPPAARRRALRLAIVVRMRLYRDGVATACAAHDDVEVVAADAGRTPLRDLLRRSEPDIVLLDVVDGEGPARVRAARAADPAVRVVALGITEDDTEILPLLEAGASGYVTPDDGMEALLAAIDAAARGEVRCSGRVAASMAARLAQFAAAAAVTPAAPSERDGRVERPAAALTVREQEIAELLEQGLSNKEIAARLCIEVATVKNHVHRILGKLQVRRRAEAGARLRA